MCGIVGYVGTKNAKSPIIEGLKRLEYRGYDSSGIALIKNGQVEVRKAKGRIEELETIISDEAYDGTIGIGHTRWATHGVPSHQNAHPHKSTNGDIAIVHNGIIENYVELRQWLSEEKNVHFVSETDSEVIAHLVELFYEDDLLEAVYKACAKMKGAYGIGAICSHEPDTLVAARKDSPLVVGLCEDGNFIASDIPAILNYTRKVYLIENEEFVVLKKDEVTIYDQHKNKVDRGVYEVTWSADAAEKDGYDHFMLKEIYEQPKGIEDTLKSRISEKGEIKLDGINLTKETLENINKIYIVACGTAYHAGLVGKYAIEKFAKIPVEVDIASEFRYRDPFVDKNTLLIAVSQSGETLDTLAALREAKRKGARILSVVNVVGSSVARESDDVFYTWAGPEISVASTKAYTTQLVCMYLIALYMAREKDVMEKSYYDHIIEHLMALPNQLGKFLENIENIKEIANEQYEKEDIFFIGRGTDVGVSYEGALKLKEISYINAFAIAAGELKHGTIALIEEGTIMIAVATQDYLYEKMLSNIQEIKARGAYVIAIAKEGDTRIEKHGDKVIYIPNTMDEIASILAIVPLQIFAYYIALNRGCDIDKPKNLAKSVTVE